ncbi:alpha/beta fold hydrolase [Sphingomonas swuensis]|uniref:Alpha/beta fold hydrolase n=1 Tax=Sphingomonas swuensis TaxID=977800 RepID=A0ABP7SRK0_9SPHN
MADDLAPPLAAPQQRRAPRPLPLFLELVREVAAGDPALAKAALTGLRRYEEAEEPPPGRERPVVASVDGTCLRDCGGDGPVLVLVPSLINPPTILDLDPDCSLAEALARDRRVLLLDWGPAAERATLTLSEHVTRRLLPLLAEIGPAILAGYCLGGTLSLAAARLRPEVTAVVTLASPWHFSAYPESARASLRQMLAGSAPVARHLGVLPMELLQSSFWMLDPERTVAKFARFAMLEPGSAESRRFVALELWANAGEALPLPAATELVETLFGADAPGRDCWLGGGLPDCPTLHVTASGDRIVPAASAASGPRLDSPSGHVGMIVGRHAPETLHAPLRQWLEGLGRRR